jgi:hypothetical protein
MIVHRIVLRCRPSANNRSYHHWQTARLIFFLAHESKTGALQELSQLLAQHRWTLIETLERSTVIEERVREAGGEIWAAYELASRRGYWMRIDPDHFASGKDGIPPVRPPRVDESFIDRIVIRAGGRRLTDAERNYEKTRNADYRLGNFIIELKDVQEEGMEKPERQHKLAALFLRYFPDETEILIDPKQLSPEDARLYARIVGASVRERVKDAASQIKATKTHLGDAALQGGVIVLNSGYYSIATEDFEELVEHSARHDTSQLDLAVCVTAGYTTDGFNSWLNFKFYPQESRNDLEERLSAAFGDVVGEFMTEWGRGGFAQPATPAPLPAVIVFTHEGKTFRYFPPNLAPRWTPQSMGG